MKRNNCWLVWMPPQQMSMAYGDWETRSDSFISNSCWPVAWISGIHICINVISWSIFHRNSMGRFFWQFCQIFLLLLLIHRNELASFSITCSWKEFFLSDGNLWWNRPAGPEYQIAWWPRVFTKEAGRCVKVPICLCSQKWWLFLNFFSNWSFSLVLLEGAILLCISCPHKKAERKFSCVGLLEHSPGM